ncbi:MAG: acyltransferase [Acidimicrobiales bacterium]
MGDEDAERPISDEQVAIEPWHAVWSEDGTWPGQEERHAAISDRTGATLGDRVYLAEDASIACESLAIGDRSYVAKGCVLRDRITIGEDCTLNPYVTMAGRVTLGDGVRIASYAALYGFNHVFDDVETPIWWQGLTERGIVVEDDVWIGTHVVICDGVTVGAHSVLGAGSVVTKDVPPYSVVGGVPARTIYDRRDRRPSRPRRDALTELDRRVTEQWRDVLERCRADGQHAVAGYVDAPGEAWKVRPTCDAVEIAAALGEPAAAGPTDDLVAWLSGLQDPATGLFPEPGEPPLDDDPLRLRLDAEYHAYGVLSVGYALEVLGASPPRPVHVVEQLEADELVARLDGLPWPTLAWPAGAWVDFYGTAVYLNRRYHGSIVGLEPLMGWLTTRVDRHSGMWGQVDRGAWGWLMPVNGFYRLTRGTYAQFDIPLPHPEAAIDTVALHCRENGWFEERNRSACNVLDVVHPIWLAAKQTDHRRAELRDALAAMLADTCRRWVDGEGFAFAPDQPCGLQGTEMWLSIVYLLAHHLGESDGLAWRPRGVHRLEPVGAAHR